MCYFCTLFCSAVSFEIPDLPEVPDVTLPSVTQSMISEKEKLSRTVSSSSSTASSCSSFHLPLSKTNRYSSKSRTQTLAQILTSGSNGCKRWTSLQYFDKNLTFIHLFPSAQHHKTVVASFWWNPALWAGAAPPPGAALPLRRQHHQTQTQHPALLWSLTLLQ